MFIANIINFFTSLAIRLLAIPAKATGVVELSNPISGINNLFDSSDYVGGVLSRILAVVGAIALLVMIYGGVMIIAAAGNESKIKEGQNLVIYTVIGLVVIFTAYFVIGFVFDTFGV